MSWLVQSHSLPHTLPHILDLVPPATIHVLTLAPPPLHNTHTHTHTQVLDLVPLANKVEKLAGRCSHCDAPGLFSMRVAADSRQTLVGGSDKYVPACR